MRTDNLLARGLCRLVGIPGEVVDEKLRRDAEVDARKKEDLRKAAESLREEQQLVGE